MIRRTFIGKDSSGQTEDSLIMEKVDLKKVAGTTSPAVSTSRCRAMAFRRCHAGRQQEAARFYDDNPHRQAAPRPASGPHDGTAGSPTTCAGCPGEPPRRLVGAPHQMCLQPDLRQHRSPDTRFTGSNVVHRAVDQPDYPGATSPPTALTTRTSFDLTYIDVARNRETASIEASTGRRSARSARQERLLRRVPA